MNLARIVALFLFLAALSAEAQTYLSEEICGDGIDNDNSSASGWGGSITGHAAGDAVCTGLLDNDQDGYVADDDCDDTNRYIFPSDYTYHTTGCGGGQVRKCQADGTYTACAAWACPGSNCYYIDPVSGNDANAGTIGSPWASFGPMDNNCVSNCHAPTAGDVFVLRSGTYIKAAQQLYVNSKSGSSGSKIVMMAYPAETPVIDSSGTSEAYIFEFVNSDYWVIEGLTFRDNYGDAIQMDDAQNWIVRRNYFDTNRGGTGNNRSSIKLSSSSGSADISNNLFDDSTGIFLFTGVNNRIHHNVFFQDSSAYSRSFVNFKHGAANTNLEVDNNIIFNIFAGAVFEQPAIWTATSAHIHDNLLHTIADAGITVQGDLGGPAFLVDIEINNNTIINSGKSIHAANIDDAAIDDNAGPINIHDNLVIDDAAAYTGNASGMVVIDPDGINTAFTHWVTGGLIQITDNCYYNASLPALTGAFELFSGGESSGATYNFSGWQATAGYDGSGANEDPLLNNNHVATSTNCDTAGRQLTPDGTTTTTTTTTTSTLPPPVPSSPNSPTKFRRGQN